HTRFSRDWSSDVCSSDLARAFATAAAPHRGPVFLDVHMDHLFGPAGPARPGEIPDPPERPADPERLARVAALLKAARRPVLVLGSDVWMDGAETAARAFAEELQLPVVANGQARGVLPAGHELLVTRARGAAFRDADLVVVAGAPL